MINLNFAVNKLCVILTSESVVSYIACEKCQSQISYEAYIGIIVTAMGIAVTLLIGYQIYNMVEINKRIRKIQGLETSMYQQNHKIESIFHISEGNMLYTQAQTLLFQSIQAFSVEAKNKCFSRAFILFHCALGEFTLYDNRKIENVLDNMEKCVKDISTTTIDDSEYQSLQSFHDSITKAHCYTLISKRYELCISQFISKVNR